MCVHEEFETINRGWVKIFQLFSFEEGFQSHFIFYLILYDSWCTTYTKCTLPHIRLERNQTIKRCSSIKKLSALELILIYIKDRNDCTVIPYCSLILLDMSVSFNVKYIFLIIVCIKNVFLVVSWWAGRILLNWLIINHVLDS